MIYTINSINKEEGTVNVTFELGGDIDGVEQVLTAPLTNIEELKNFLWSYGTAYEAGINQQKTPELSEDISNIVGQSIEATPPEGYNPPNDPEE
jgi:hypothetical protein